MSDKFKFIQDRLSGKWVILAPQRASRPDDSTKEQVCPFCPGNEDLTPPEILRTPAGSEKDKWQIRVVPNKFPFAPIHEVIIHSPNHSASFFTYSKEYVAEIFQIYKNRFNALKDKGQVFIFHNQGPQAGESLSHSHTQIPVVPPEIVLEVPAIANQDHIVSQTLYFTCFIAEASSWPNEVWFLPKRRGADFGQITAEELSDFSLLFTKLLAKLEKSSGEEFSFNFYISPKADWYLRLIPREKILGGFELGTGVYVNTKDPSVAAKELAF